AQILAWKQIDEVWDLAHFVAVTRPGHALELPQAEGAKITQLEVPALAISSTDVRDRATAGKPIWYLVPDGVVQYIAKHRLYRGLGD
ncbi:MAG: nicotinic acid mononucleotide adenylyltransferase, partial [Aquiluna sp.]